MTLFGIWTNFGFRDNPYSQDTLAADAVGDELLVGREDEIRRVQTRIASGGAHASIEGPVGVGKTSLINVASFRMARDSARAKDGVLWLPANARFQPEVDAQAFETAVYRAVAQTLIDYSGEFKLVGLEEPRVDDLDKWLNSPEYSSWTGGAFSVSAGRGSEPNTGEGFAQAGFPAAVKAALARTFPAGTGGIICVLDNLEILESAGKARNTLDELRDRIFNIPGLRWVLCGSRGIVSRARTERLSAIFQAPIHIGPLSDSAAIDAIRARIRLYGLSGSSAPVTPEGFEFIYRALNNNLREAMSTAQEFSHWMSEEFVSNSADMPPDDEKSRLLESWLLDRAEVAQQDARQVQARHWQFFDALCKDGGRTGSADFEKYGFGTQQQLVSAVTALVDTNLAVREVDPDNGARTVNSVTPIGWLVSFYRREAVGPLFRTEH